VVLQHRLPTASQRRRGSMKIVKRKGDNVSPWRVPLYLDGKCGGVAVDGHIVCVGGRV